MKRCTICGEFKELTEFNKQTASKDGHFYCCRKCGIEADIKRSRANGVLPMGENKTCASYLGIAVAERLIRHMFNDVEVMPHNNPKFDFICAKDKKIDVKSACIVSNLGKYLHWSFHINKNTVADYFLLLAFDNREDLEPMYQWLIPGDKLNHLTGASISPSTISKWDSYRQPIGPALTCCNSIRSVQFSRA